VGAFQSFLSRLGLLYVYTTPTHFRNTLYSLARESAEIDESANALETLLAVFLKALKHALECAYMIASYGHGSDYAAHEHGQ
jgi:hypothetical protein